MAVITRQKGVYRVIQCAREGHVQLLFEARKRQLVPSVVDFAVNL